MSLRGREENSTEPVMSKKLAVSTGEVTAWLWGEFSSMAAINSLALACFSSHQEMDSVAPPLRLTLMPYPNSRIWWK